MTVSAKDLGTGKEQHITISGGSRMSDEEIDKAVKEAQEYEAQDKKRKEAIDARNDADSFVFQTEKAMKEAGDKIDPAQKKTVEDDIASLRTVLDRTANQTDISDADVDALKSGRDKLMNDAQALFAQMYNQQNAGGAGAGANAGAGAGSTNQGSSNGSGKGDDDVVDGEYKEV